MTGTKLLSNRYQLLSKLGAGGMGSVWTARDHTLAADVAVKLMDPQLVGSPVALARFRREAHAAAAIRSSYVVQILDYGVDVDDNIPFIAMELLNGESLAARLKRIKTLAPDVTARIMGHVGRALTLAHEQGIVHRDLKPDNIFLVHEGDEELGKVLDFGIARRNEGLGQSTGLETQAGSILGTPFYMSPEQAGGDQVDALSDIWAYGVVTCECLVGARPFQADSLGGLFRAICLDPLPVPSRLASVPSGFDAWFARAVARDKAARFASIAEATRELRSVCASSATSPVATTPAHLAVPHVAAPNVAVAASASPAEQPTVTFERTTPPSVHSIPYAPAAPPRRARWLVLAAGALAATVYLGVLLTSRLTDSSAVKASADSASVLLVSASKPPTPPASSPPPATTPAPQPPPTPAVVAASASESPSTPPRESVTIRSAQPQKRSAKPTEKTGPGTKASASPSSTATAPKKNPLDLIKDRQ